MAEDRQHKGYMALLGRMQKGRKSKKREGSELHGGPIWVAQVAASLLFAEEVWEERVGQAMVDTEWRRRIKGQWGPMVAQWNRLQ